MKMKAMMAGAISLLLVGVFIIARNAARAGKFDESGRIERRESGSSSVIRGSIDRKPEDPEAGTAKDAEAAMGRGPKPEIQAVFVLDSTGSMGGMIDGAKAKIWSIAHTLASTEPAPHLRVGLITYRDRGDAYVTKRIDPTTDLDAVYEELMSYQADGGGDAPESVNRALHEAVSKVEWPADSDAYRVVFLVGDCPPHEDYKDDVPYKATCALARRKDININTILCGEDEAAHKIWNEIANRANGGFTKLDQDGDAILVSTPHDTVLAGLSVELDATRIFYGTEEERAQQRNRERLAERIRSASSAMSMAQRASFNASDAGQDNFAAGPELIRDYAQHPDRLARLPRSHLPAELRELSDSGLEMFVRRQASRRAELRREIARVAEERQQFIRKELAKTEGREESSLEYNVFQRIKEQTLGKNQCSLSAGIY